MFKQTVDAYLTGLQTKLNQINADRKVQLNNIADVLKFQIKEKGSSELIFICTHNSRRSQICELFFKIALRLVNNKHVKAYSGGTESTAFYPAAVEAARSKGLSIVEKKGSIVNHTYLTTYNYELPVIKQFSKKYNDNFNPQSGFVAVMVCDSANEACPIVLGAKHRVSLLYKDPKFSDGSTNQADVYSAKVDEIALEMLFLALAIAE